MTDFSPVPLTIEGSSVLHQVFDFDWKAWRSSPWHRHRNSGRSHHHPPRL